MTSSKLALFGGKKVRNVPMPFRRAFGEKELRSLNRVIKFYKNKKVDPPYRGKFEKEFSSFFSKYMGGGYSCAVSTGTASIYVALQAFNLKPKSEIIISPFCDAGPLNCIILQGYTPVIADTETNSYNCDAKNFLSKITKKTSAIILVHSAGESIKSISFLAKKLKKKNIKLIEDCSQAPGARVGTKKVGSFGDIACFSTMYTKTLTSGASGGLIFTKNKKLYRRTLACSDRGKPTWKSDYDFRNPGMHLFPGLNWNTDEFSCAIGNSSLRRLDKTVKLRMQFIEQLKKRLNKKSRICKVYELPKNSSPFFLPIWVNIKKIKCSKKTFAEALQKEGINLNPDYKFLISDWKWAKKYIKHPIKTPNATDVRNKTFNLFLNENYGKREINDFIKSILKVEKYYIK